MSAVQGVQTARQRGRITTDMLNSSGIYQIRNTVNGKIYIGSAKKFQARFLRHLSLLRAGSHHSKILQSAWSKHGEQNFLFEPLITCSKSMLLYYEQQFLDNWTPDYNVCKTAGNTLGVVCSTETREKIRLKNTGRKLSEAHKAAISPLGRKHSELAILNMGAAQKQLVRDPKHLAAAGNRTAIRNIDPLFIAKMAETKRGKPVKLSAESQLRRLQNIRDYNQSRVITDELKANISEGLKNAPKNERIEFDGVSLTVLQWSERCGIDRHTLRKRLNMGWGI